MSSTTFGGRPLSVPAPNAQYARTVTIQSLVSLSGLTGAPLAMRTAAYTLLAVLGSFETDTIDRSGCTFPPKPTASNRFYSNPVLPMVSMQFVLDVRRMESGAPLGSQLQVAAATLCHELSDGAVVELATSTGTRTDMQQPPAVAAPESVTASLTCAPVRLPVPRTLFSEYSDSDSDATLDSKGRRLPSIRVKRSRTEVAAEYTIPPRASTSPRPRTACPDHFVWRGSGLLSPCKNCGAVK